MPVAGLVLQLAPDEDIACAALDRIGADGAFTIGEAPAPGRVPVVMESDDAQHSRRQLRWLEQLPGVASVLVVSVDASDLRPTAAPHLQAPSSPDDKGVSSS